MKFRSRKPKPEVGMEMSVTLSLPPGLSVEEHAAALVKFWGKANETAKEVGSAWGRVYCTGIPVELEGALQSAIEKAEKRPNLSLVVNSVDR